jgi:uncharacterized protein YndB with AHSA1/START domain
MTPKTTAHAVAHGTFSIERSYPQSPSRVFAAFATQSTRRRWFVEGEGWEVFEFTFDFRVGGGEMSRFSYKGGPEIRNDTMFHDIVRDRRIVLAYRMTVGDRPISVSLTTIELTPAGRGTLLRYTEQGAFLDGADQLPGRESGCRGLLEKLAEELNTSP